MLTDSGPEPASGVSATAIGGTKNEGPAGEDALRHQPDGLGSTVILSGIVLLTLLFRERLIDLFSVPVLQAWSTVFVAICVQAIPFLALGVIVSGAIAAFVPNRALTRLMPERRMLAVPVAGICGAALPGCECGSVPIADRLMERGVPTSAALAFLLSAPAINPIVLVATAVAFSGDQRMVWARLIAGLLTAVVVGWIWERIGRPSWMKPRARDRARAGNGTGSRWGTFNSTLLADFAPAAGFLVIGAAAAATFKVLVPSHLMESAGSSLLISILLMAGLAFILALCSEADAFVAAAFSTIPFVGKLVFLTVGPAVDVKLVAMQAGVFGRRFAFRFAPLTFIVAIVVGTVVGLLFTGGWA